MTTPPRYQSLVASSLDATQEWSPTIVVRVFVGDMIPRAGMQLFLHTGMRVSVIAAM